MDAAGKDGTIKHVMSGVNPQGCQVYQLQAARRPRSSTTTSSGATRGPCPSAAGSASSTARTTRRCWSSRSIPSWSPAAAAATPSGTSKFWEDRYDDINAFERHLAATARRSSSSSSTSPRTSSASGSSSGSTSPSKHWKFSAADLAERAHWDDYMAGLRGRHRATSTKWAPWYVIPADHKWAMRAAVADIIVTTLRSLDMGYPEVTHEQRTRMAAAKAELEAEGTA